MSVSRPLLTPSSPLSILPPYLGFSLGGPDGLQEGSQARTSGNGIIPLLPVPHALQAAPPHRDQHAKE